VIRNAASWSLALPSDCGLHPSKPNTVFMQKNKNNWGREMRTMERWERTWGELDGEVSGNLPTDFGFPD